MEAAACSPTPDRDVETAATAEHPAHGIGQCASVDGGAGRGGEVLDPAGALIERPHLRIVDGRAQVLAIGLDKQDGDGGISASRPATADLAGPAPHTTKS